MGEPHVVSALREKRAEIAGAILELERRMARHRADLMHLDATLRLVWQPRVNHGRKQLPLMKSGLILYLETRMLKGCSVSAMPPPLPIADERK